MNQLGRGARQTAVLAAIVCALAMSRSSAVGAQGPPTARSRELFQRMYAVFENPRCMNCHTGEDFPRQGDDQHRHTMGVSRGSADRGARGLHCSACHQEYNQLYSGVPGAPDWHLAPVRMAWKGLSAAQLCRALRDPNMGNMQPVRMEAHFDTGLVRWAWNPGVSSHGARRTTPALSREELITLTRQWIESGAECPSPGGS